MRVRWILAVAALFVAAFPSTVQAGDGWRVVDAAGVVRVGGPGFMPVSLTRDQELPADAWIETASGRAVLVRGHETVVVEPNSRIQLPGAPVNGNTQVLQTLGSALYKIGKQKKPHFQVDTPYMAAVVKGTAFTVTVGDDQAAVAVTEGLVEVSTPGLEDVEFVRPGFTALVSRENNGEISIERSRGSDHGNSDAPKGEYGNSKPVLIPAAIGDVEVDVKEVSNGLLANDAVLDHMPPGKDPEKETGLANHTGRTSPAAVDTPKDDVKPLGDAGGPIGLITDGGPKGDSGVLGDVADTVDAIRVNGKALGLLRRDD
jgi:hypothetical protein